MSMTTQPATPWPINDVITGVRHGNHRLFQFSIIWAVGALACVLLMILDHRLFHGVSVWDKPAKFFLSLMVQFVTVSWALSLLTLAQRARSGIRWAVVAMIIAAITEMAYMIFRASRAEASHFNDSSVFAQIMYGVMGLGAVILTATAFYVGLIVWRNRGTDLVKHAAGLGLMLGMVLTTLVAGYMSSTKGHWVGGPLSDAQGLGFFSWSTTGGDLRISHFVSMHAAQIIPFSAVNGSKSVVYLVALLCVTATAATFAIAVMGVPLLRAA